MLEELLTIKRRREDDAAALVGEAQRTVDQRRAACRAKRTALDEHDVWQEAEKSRLYEEVHRKSVTRAKLEGYRERIGLLRQRQLELEEALEKAGRELATAEAELEETRRKRLDAHRQVVKFEEYQALLEAEHEREAERKEEAEAEDIAPLRP